VTCSICTEIIFSVVGGKFTDILLLVLCDVMHWQNWSLKFISRGKDGFFIEIMVSRAIIIVFFGHILDLNNFKVENVFYNNVSIYDK
jgi:hypothetical protein